MLQQGIMALPYDAYIDYDDTLGVDLDQSPADVGFFKIPMKCEIIEVGGIVTETCAGGSTTPEMSFDKRPTAGSDNNRAEIGLLKLLTTAAGKVMYDKAPRGTILYPGQEIVCKVKTQATGTSAAGHARPYILVKPLDETKANLANMVETT
ncbi:MAG: hypothetical protein BWY37_02154 [Firmicutes bacterium ADurb.Bin262]|nr:MAG: hypothetical protein BWY37_02154 [Firmicutes bacterium ADurb.Bin262]